MDDSNNIDEILNFIRQSSARMRENYVKKNFPKFHQNIINCHQHHQLPDDITFKEKLWYYYNGVTETVLCKTCQKNRTTFNKNFDHGYRDYCSSECNLKNEKTKNKRKQTNYEKYGVDNVAKDENIKQKTVETNLKRYGTKSTFQNEEVKAKYRETIFKKYNTDHYFKTNEFQEKKEKTMLKKYGKKHFTQTDLYLDKTIDTNRKKFGVDFPIQRKDELEKREKTNYEKYGSKTYLTSDDWKEAFTDDVMKDNQNKAIQTNLERYGVKYYPQTDEFKEHIRNSRKLKELYNSTTEAAIEKYYQLGFDFIKLDLNENKLHLIHHKCDNYFEIIHGTFQGRNKAGIEPCLYCNPANGRSNKEKEIVKFLVDHDIKCITNSKKIINPYELDIYLPDYNIAIEFNGLYWHNEFNKDKYYHLNKTNLCEEKGIDLLHIFEDDWVYRNKIVKNILLNKLNLIKNKIYARNCTISENIPHDQIKNFLDENHIQGDAPYKHKIGLFYNNELVSLMTFGNFRHNLNDDETELIRFCTKRGVNIIGGASKLFQYFIRNYQINKVNSYCDKSIFNGDLYKKLGFKREQDTPLNYWWVIDDMRYNRFKFRKDKLVKEGYNPDKTEHEIMHSLGHSRVYGCGSSKWVFEKA